MTRVYGHDKTIHRTGYLDVETYNGKVVSVWFRCQQLPFKQHPVDSYRKREMEGVGENLPNLVAVEVEDQDGRDN